MAAAGGEQIRSGAVCHSALMRYHNWTLVGPKMDSYSLAICPRVGVGAWSEREGPAPARFASDRPCSYLFVGDFVGWTLPAPKT
jgi:hypothetical protein